MPIGTEIQKQLDELTQLSNNQKSGESFDNIELDETEVEEALRAGREKKHYKIKEAEYRERITKPFSYPSFSADDMFEFYKLQYDVDEHNISIVENLCKYFSNDSRFEGDLNKGLFLMGGVGVGKTSLMKFFYKNQRLSYRVESCRDVETKYAEMGDNYIDRCSFNMPIATNSDPFGHQVIGVCFDDLGTEANGKHYGKEKNVMAEIILNRYDNNIPFISTHITTNLTSEAVKAQYGSRVTDRLRQMFNIIQFKIDAKSRRV